MNASMKKTFVFVLMLGLNWLPFFFCDIFYYKGALFLFPILLILLLLLCIGNYFAAGSLIKLVALSFDLIASTVIGTLIATDNYTTRISSDGMSYAIGFVGADLALLFVLSVSFVTIMIKNKQIQKRSPG